jgi:hypothetical protein
MRKIVLLSVAAVLAGLTAAKAQSAEAQGAPLVGVGIICNTSDQAEQFVNLRANGLEVRRVMETINAQAKDPRACGVAAVAFTRDKILATRTMGNKFVQIVRITVVAGYNGTAWQRVSGLMTQYAVMEGEGETI